MGGFGALNMNRCGSNVGAWLEMDIWVMGSCFEVAAKFGFKRGRRGYSSWNNPFGLTLKLLCKGEIGTYQSESAPVSPLLACCSTGGGSLSLEIFGRTGIAGCELSFLR